MIKQGENLLQKENKRKINYTKWAFVLGTPIALVSAIAAVVSVPEIRCNLGWQADCVVQKQLVEIITQDETGTVLSGVRVQVISQGAPEVQTTDNNGYVQVKIPRKGKIVVNLSKEGYPTQNITIDLENEQSTTRRVTLGKSGTIQVQQNLNPTISNQQTSGVPQSQMPGNISSTASPDALNSSLPANTNTFANDSGIFPSKYAAKWEGTITFTNSETKSSAQSGLTLTFNNGKIGSKVGTVFYQSGYCNGTLILQNIKSSAVELFENITNGSSDCTKNSSVTVTFKGDDIIEFKRAAAGNQNIGSGLLTRQK
jgi:Carboxypeptidase regulatory-like domain